MPRCASARIAERMLVEAGSPLASVMSLTISSSKP
jgi:hypothetical protein